MRLDREEVVKRLCALSSTVMTRRFGCDLAADCFCEDARQRRPDRIDEYRFDQEVLEFIEQAVKEKLEKADAVNSAAEVEAAERQLAKAQYRLRHATEFNITPELAVVKRALVDRLEGVIPYQHCASCTTFQQATRELAEDAK